MKAYTAPCMVHVDGYYEYWFVSLQLVGKYRTNLQYLLENLEDSQITKYFRYALNRIGM